MMCYVLCRHFFIKLAKIVTDRWDVGRDLCKD